MIPKQFNKRSNTKQSNTNTSQAKQHSNQLKTPTIYKSTLTQPNKTAKSQITITHRLALQNPPRSNQTNNYTPTIKSNQINKHHYTINNIIKQSNRKHPKHSPQQQPKQKHKQNNKVN